MYLRLGAGEPLDESTQPTSCMHRQDRAQLSVEYSLIVRVVLGLDCQLLSSTYSTCGSVCCGCAAHARFLGVLLHEQCGEVSSVQGKSDFSLPGEVEPKEQPQDPPCSTKPAQPLDRRDEFQVHLTAALDVLSPAEQHRLMTALCQPSTSACVDALWAICTCCAVDDDQLDAAVLHSPGQQSHGEDCGGSSQCRHTNAPAGSLRREAVDTTTEAHFCVEAKSMAPWAHAGFRVQPQHGSLQYTSYDQLPGAENVPDASQKRSRVPTKRLLGSELGCDFDSSESEDTVAKHRKKPTKTTPKLSSTPNTTHPDASAHTDCAAVASKPAKLVREARSRSSVRDRIWDLLTDVEKGRLVREQMSSAEGTVSCFCNASFHHSFVLCFCDTMVYLSQMWLTIMFTIESV